MANNVFVNGREVSCKAADGKSICAFPDTCLSPPSPPAGPLPVPYPNTGEAKDTTDGSKSVKVTGKEVMLKDRSYFKKSTGDEAATRSLGMGVVTHTITGKVYFTSWSMDVKIEGENAVRHLDMTTHNHMSSPPNTPPWMHTDTMFFGDPAACSKEVKEAKKACKVEGKPKKMNCSDKCKEKSSCILLPKGKDKAHCCPPDTTGEHQIEDHWVRPGGKLQSDFAKLANAPSGPYRGAPCACVNKSRYEGRHGVFHGTRGVHEDSLLGTKKPLKYGEAKKWAIEAHNDAFPKSGCRESCLEAQLDAFYGKNPNKKCSTSKQRQPLTESQRAAAKRRIRSR